MNRSLYKSFIPFATYLLIFAIQCESLRAALLAYEPFTNSVGANIIGSGDGFGFSGAWQANSSSGVATNIGYGLGYTDTASNTLVTVGGAGFFQGLTSGAGDMKPIRLFSVGRGTNGTDGVTTWISFLIARQGPTGTLAGNPYGRGANLPHDIDSGAIQKLAIGNSSNAGSNTVGLIPTGNGANLKGSTNTFGGVTNFVVVRIDHVAGVANDRAYLFVNPNLNAEPSTNSAGAFSTNSFDFSFDRLRIFAGGQSSAAQPYAELIVDEYRMGETYADVTPVVSNSSPIVATGPIVITNVALLPGGIVLSGKGGSNGMTYFVLSTTNLNTPLTNWPTVATNVFAANGNFVLTNPIDIGEKFYRLYVPGIPAIIGPSILSGPASITVTQGQTAVFGVSASGAAPLNYQWYFNTNTPLSGQTTTNLTIANAQTTNAGVYSVIVSNAVGSVASGQATLTVLVPPAILSGPASLTVTQGQTAAFNVTASGTAPLSYQWYFNTNTILSGQTGSNLTLLNVQLAKAGSYSVRVSNVVNNITSTQAVLTVLAPPSIVTQPINQGALLADSATFTVAASGTAPLSYQWYFNTNTALLNATNASYNIASTAITNGGSYSVRITNNYGAVTSDIVRLTINDYSVTNGAYFVSLSGSDANPGTYYQPFLTITKGLNTITTNGKIYLRGGTFAQPAKLSLTRIGTTNGAIRMWAYPGENPVVNSSGNSSDGISISGQKYHLKGITVMLAGHNGINISGHSNTVENCVTYSNGNTGLHITGGTSGTTFPSYNLILNCDSYLNYDPPIGGNADGFSAKWDMGPGNVFKGCRAWWNSDDGWDFWMANSPLVIDGCWAFYNGTNYWGDPAFNGNGNGLKLGGNYIGAPHRTVRSVAFRNEANGIDQNNNILGQTLDNNTSWANKARNYSMAHGTNTTPHVIRNNLSFAGASTDSWTGGTLFTSNSWQVVTSPAANASDVLSVDESIARAPRNSDGSLPYWPFLRPVPAGRLIDKGVNVGDPFTGASPDLGAFEDGL